MIQVNANSKEQTHTVHLWQFFEDSLLEEIVNFK